MIKDLGGTGREFLRFGFAKNVPGRGGAGLARPDPYQDSGSRDLRLPFSWRCNLLRFWEAECRGEWGAGGGRRNEGARPDERNEGGHRKNEN